MKEVLEKGSVTLPKEDLSRYNTDTLSFMKEIGCIVMEDIVIPSESGYFLIFYDPLKEYIVVDIKKTVLILFSYNIFF